MASELRVNTLKDASGNNSVGLSFVANGSAKAWVFASNSASLNDSFSISSGTDHGTGDYSYALSNAFSSANFAQQSTSGSGTPTHSATTNHSRITSSRVAIETSDNSSNYDKQHHVTVHGDLA